MGRIIRPCCHCRWYRFTLAQPQGNRIHGPSVRKRPLEDTASQLHSPEDDEHATVATVARARHLRTHHPIAGVLQPMPRLLLQVLQHRIPHLARGIFSSPVFRLRSSSLLPMKGFGTDISGRSLAETQGWLVAHTLEYCLGTWSIFERD